MEVFFLGLGGNIGNRLNNLIEAIRQLHFHKQINVTQWSSVYETDPVGYTEQPPFLNMVLKIESSLSPLELIMVTQGIERKLGRKRDMHWGPRTLDIDILLFENKTFHNGELIIPHPRMQERAFVIVPLAEIAPCIELPGTSETPLSLLNKLQRKDGVKKWKHIGWDTVFDHSES